MGMGIARAHHGAAIFEDLHMTDFRARPKSVNSAVQASTTRTMSATSMPARVRLWSGWKHKHAANAALALRPQQPMANLRCPLRASRASSAA